MSTKGNWAINTLVSFGKMNSIPNTEVSSGKMLSQTVENVISTISCGETLQMSPGPDLCLKSFKDRV